MNNILCPFCKEILTDMIYSNYYQCNNHGNVKVIIEWISNPECYWLFNSMYWVKIPFDKNECIKVIKDNDRVGCTIPFDPNLTPENLEEKLKLYLTFK
jgi:hypothetical protein